MHKEFAISKSGQWHLLFYQSRIILFLNAQFTIYAIGRAYRKIQNGDDGNPIMGSVMMVLLVVLLPPIYIWLFEGSPFAKQTGRYRLNDEEISFWVNEKQVKMIKKSEISRIEEGRQKLSLTRREQPEEFGKVFNVEASFLDQSDYLAIKDHLSHWQDIKPIPPLLQISVQNPFLFAIGFGTLLYVMYLSQDIRIIVALGSFINGLLFCIFFRVLTLETTTKGEKWLVFFTFLLTLAFMVVRIVRVTYA